MGWLSYAHIIIYSIYTGPISHWGESKYCQVSNGNCGGCGYRLASRLEKRSSRSSPLRSLSLNNRTELSLSLSRRRNPEWVAPRRDSQNGSRFSGSRGWKSAMKSEPKSAARRAVQPVATWHRVTGVRPKWTNKRGSWFHPLEWNWIWKETTAAPQFLNSISIFRIWFSKIVQSGQVVASGICFVGASG